MISRDPRLSSRRRASRVRSLDAVKEGTGGHSCGTRVCLSHRHAWSPTRREGCEEAWTMTHEPHSHWTACFVEQDSRLVLLDGSRGLRLLDLLFSERHEQLLDLLLR